jgi:succinate dehydrogenase / fumarate reductase cytochrome b subunit
MATATRTPPASGRTAYPLPRTSVARKQLVAVTGGVGVLFVLAHMAGNLHAFQGPRQLNHYSEYLRSLGEPLLPRSALLWVLRIVLLAAVTIHIALTAQLALRSRAARPIRYVHTGVVQASYASRTMRWGGAALLAFIVFHLMDLSWGVHPHYIRGDVYHNVVTGFRRWPVTVVYLAAMGALGMHLYHGTWSVFQTLGVNGPRWDRAIRRGAVSLALLVAVGYTTVPIAVLVHLVK